MDTPTQKEQEFIERTQKRRLESVEGLCYKFLGFFLKEDICHVDFHYLDKRIRQIAEEACKKVNFKNAAIEKARLDFLKVVIAEARRNIPKLKKKRPKDATEERDQRCEPSAQHMIDEIINEALLFDDPEWLSEGIEQDDSLFLQFLIRGYMDAVYQKMVMILGEHERRTNKILWGKEVEDITFSDMQAVFDSVKPTKK